MGISVLYVRISSLDGKTDRQRVNEKEFDKVIEDKCSGSIPMFGLIHSFTGGNDSGNKKRTRRNTDPSCVVAGAGLEPTTFGL